MEERFADVTKHLPWFADHPVLTRWVEGFCGIAQTRQLFADAAEAANPPAEVARRIGMTVAIEDLEREVPREGAVVIVANHSHGGPDALALAARCLALRPDTLILGNAELMGLPGLAQHLLPVTLLKEGSAAENTASLRAMLKHVKGGGALVVFPAGRVAFWQRGEVKDPPWNDHIVKLIGRMEAMVVPVWFYGGVQPWVQILSKGHNLIRTALIPRGLLGMRGGTMRGRAGKSFPAGVLKKEEAGWLRKQLEGLRDLGN